MASAQCPVLEHLEQSGHLGYLDICVIWDILGPFWATLDHFGPFWTALDHFGTFQTIFDHLKNFGPFWTTLDHYKPLEVYGPYGPDF